MKVQVKRSSVVLSHSPSYNASLNDTLAAAILINKVNIEENFKGQWTLTTINPDEHLDKIFSDIIFNKKILLNYYDSRLFNQEEVWELMFEKNEIEEWFNARYNSDEHSRAELLEIVSNKNKDFNEVFFQNVIYLAVVSGVIDKPELSEEKWKLIPMGWTETTAKDDVLLKSIISGYGAKINLEKLKEWFNQKYNGPLLGPLQKNREEFLKIAEPLLNLCDADLIETLQMSKSFQSEQPKDGQESQYKSSQGDTADKSNCGDHLQQQTPDTKFKKNKKGCVLV